MEELFVNVTKCTEQEYKKFLQSYAKEYAVPELLGILFYCAFFIFCIYLTIRHQEFKLLAILIIAFILFLYYKLILVPNKRRKQANEKILGKECVNKYIFYNNFFSTISNDGEAQTLYFKMYRVVETKTNFYIYIAREYAFILSKDGFKDNKLDEFRQFIKKKALLKYRVEK